MKYGRQTSLKAQRKQSHDNPRMLANKQIWPIRDKDGNKIRSHICLKCLKLVEKNTPQHKTTNRFYHQKCWESMFI